MPSVVKGGDAEHPPNQEDSLQKRVVLIVEDDFLTRCTAAVYLRHRGFRVIEAENAREAISVLSSGSHVDVMFSDISMPGSMDGIGLAHWVAQHHPAVGILLTSARSRSTPYAFITKPYNLDEVERAFTAMLPP
jgi:two-component system, response regulator PdtaR